MECTYSFNVCTLVYNKIANVSVLLITVFFPNILTN